MWKLDEFNGFLGFGMNEPPYQKVRTGSRALHAPSKISWLHGTAAMMAFRLTRSTWKVSKLFYLICDWVRVNKNNGNVLKKTANSLVPVSDGPSGGNLVFRRFYVGLVVCFVLSTNMSKLSFRARTLDNTKPMPIYMAEELPDLPDFSAINRAVPQMPSGMQKEEECVSFPEIDTQLLA